MSNCTLCASGEESVWDDGLECYAHPDKEHPGKLKACETPWAPRCPADLVAIKPDASFYSVHDGPPEEAAVPSTTAPTPTPGVIRLVTAQEREAAAVAEVEAELKGGVLEEALGMLEHAKEIFEENGVSGVAIAFALEDGSYGRILPTMCSNVPGLIGAVATMQQDLILRTLVDDE